MSAPPSFDLERLGASDFERLCRTIFTTCVGQAVEEFSLGRDAGRDAAFHGLWNRAEGPLAGQFAVQCKFHEHRALRPSDIGDELPKIQRLVSKGLCDVYVLMTNSSMSAASAEAIRELVLHQGPRECLVWGRERIQSFIRENKELRILLPRLYGIGDLTEILDDRAYGQALALLQTFRDEMAPFVATAPYLQALKALEEGGFVMLLGRPGSGKTTTACALALAARARWKSRPVRIAGASAIADHWNPNERTQLLWIDDAFGSTQFVRAEADQWNKAFPLLRAALRRQVRVVMTSRDYIWEEAQSQLKRSSLEPIRDPRALVSVEALTLSDKAQMLYNLLAEGRQSPGFVHDVLPILPEVVERPSFLPETARRFADRTFTAKLPRTSAGVRRFFDEPVEQIHETIEELGPAEKTALGVLYWKGGRVGSPITLDAETRAAVCDRLGGSASTVGEALWSLRGGLVAFVTRNGLPGWEFRNPTVSDAFRRYLIDRPELVGLYLQGTQAEVLIREIRCGEPENEQDVPIVFQDVTRVIIHDDNFDAVLSILLNPALDRVSLESFLYYHCSPAFLRLYVQRAIADQKRLPGSTLAVRLHRLGLLDELTRTAVASDSQARLLSSLDTSCFYLAKELMTAEERQRLRAVAREVLLPDLSSLLTRLVDATKNNRPHWLLERWNGALDALDHQELGLDHHLIAARAALAGVRADLARSGLGSNPFDGIDWAEVRDVPASSSDAAIASIFADLEAVTARAARGAPKSRPSAARFGS